MTRALLSAALAIVCVAGVAAQDKPNFAGTWKAAGSFTSWTITVDGSKMTVTQTIAGNSDSTVYLLDGTPSTKSIEGPNGMLDIVHTSTWEGDVLVTTITAPQMTRIERRSIEADGTMKVEMALTMMQGKPVPPGQSGPPPQVLKRVVAALSGQDKPNFAGSWEMDRARSSRFAGGAPAMIAVDGSKMTVTRTMAGNSSSLIYMLDGTPSTNAPCPDCPPLILTSTWEGSVLVTTMASGGRVERHSIQDDGTLRIDITLTFDGKSETGTLVFNRVK